MFANIAQRIAAGGAWIAVVVVSVLLLAACGGGGGGGGSFVPPLESPNPQTLPFNVAGGIDGGMAQLSPNAAEGAANVSLNAIEGATDGEYVVQPITVTFTAQLNTVAYVFGLVIEHPLTTRNDAPVQITVSVSPLPPAEDPQVTPPPPPPTPEPEDPTQTPVSDPPPQEGGNPPENDNPGEGGNSQPEPVTPPQPTPAPEPADPPQTPVSNPPPQPTEPVFTSSLVMAKVEFRYSNDTNQLANQNISMCYEPPAKPGPNNSWNIYGDCRYSSRPVVERQQNAKVSESYFMFPDTGLNAVYTITLRTQPFREADPTVVISVSDRGEVNTVVHNSWSTISQITNFFIPDFVTVTSSSVAEASVNAFSASEFGRAQKPGTFGPGDIITHLFCFQGEAANYSIINPFISVSFRHWQSKVCPQPAGASPKHTPNKSDIASGALQDIGARGFGFADTSARFYARWGNKEKRKQAGFSYNFDTFALRTDYNKLPAAQDSGVMLDTYRVGIMPDIGKRHRLFAGVDNYRNGILAIQYTDAADTDTHTNIYKLGSVAGKGGYAVKFEWRIVWD